MQDNKKAEASIRKNMEKRVAGCIESTTRLSILVATATPTVHCYIHEGMTEALGDQWLIEGLGEYSEDGEFDYAAHADGDFDFAFLEALTKELFQHVVTTMKKEGQFKAIGKHGFEIWLNMEDFGEHQLL